MRTGLIVSLGGSAALGLAALVVARVWAPSAGQPDARRPDAIDAKSVPVVVAAEALKYGAKLEARNLAVARLPADAAPAGHFSSIEQALGGQPVVLTPIAAREPLLPAKLSGPGARASLSAEIAQGKRAYTIRVSDVTGVGGHVLPGDHVDVVLTRNLSADERSRRLVSALILQNVRVLGIDLNADPTSAKPSAAHNSTLEVTPDEAQKLSLAAELGTLSLALRRPGAEETAAARPISTAEADSWGAGASALPAAPAAPRRAAPKSYKAAAPAAEGRGAPLTIVQGSATTHVWVQTERSGEGA